MTVHTVWADDDTGGTIESDFELLRNVYPAVADITSIMRNLDEKYLTLCSLRIAS